VNLVRSHPLLAILVSVTAGYVFATQLKSVPGFNKIPQKS